MDSNERIARVTAFAALGTLTTTQQIAGSVLSLPGDADPALVAEESLALVSVVSARVIEGGLRELVEERAAVVRSVLDLPFLYQDYLLGEAIVTGSAKAGFTPDESYQRMHRKREFYLSHLSSGVFPGENLLSDKLELWMGRVSPPKTGSPPRARLESSDALGQVVSHAKILLAFCRRTIV
jgi:hypothetical protein